ncbi:MAG: hypothetical protein L6Q66_10690, partial [Bacteroidia bacterium]|nr:hypothetical protein [Bacteroidia bacterium]
MKLVILFNSAYPSFGAAAKRVGNYEKGLKALGADIQVIPIPPLTQNPLFQILVPIYTLIRILTMKPAADILFIYGFGWVSKLFIVYYGKLIKSKIVFEVNEKPHSIRGAGRRDIFLKYFAPLNQ